MRWVARCASDPRRGPALDHALWGALVLAGLSAVLAPQWLLRVAPDCLFTALLGMQCWGCGMTRAAVAVAQGQWSEAWQHNPRVFLVLPLLVWGFGRFTQRLWLARS